MIAPIVVFVMLTMIYAGIYISVVHSVQQLAADGARVSVAGIGDSERRAMTVGYVEAEAPSYFLANSRMTVDYAEDANAAVTVTVSYDAANLLGWYPSGLMPALDTTVTRSAVVRTGGF